MEPNRRSFLAAGLGTALVGLAGCSTDTSAEPTPEPLPSDPTLKWVRHYGEAGYRESFQTLLEIDGGGFLVGGPRTLDENNFGSVLLRTDRNGEELWRRMFGGFVMDAVATPDGGFLVIVRQRGEGTDELLGLGADGTNQWSETPKPSAPPWYLFNSLLPAHDGGYVLAGTHIEPVEGTGVSRGNPVVVAVSATGEVRWEQVFPAPDVLDYVDDQGNETWRPGREEVHDIVPAEEGYLLLCGTTGESSYLRRIDAAGTEVWRRYYGRRYSAVLESIARTPEGYILAGHDRGDHDSEGVDSRAIEGPWLLAVGQEGEIQWSSVYQFGEEGPTASAEFADIATDNEGAPVVAGTYHPGRGESPRSRPMLAQFSPDGTAARWGRQYGERGGRGNAVARPDEASTVLAGELNEDRSSTDTEAPQLGTDALLLDAGHPTESNVAPVRRIEGPGERDPGSDDGWWT